MKLTVFAATGGIGRLILDQALAAGHDVTAVVRNPDRLNADGRPPERVRVVRADLADADPQVLESAVAGADAVLSGLGARSSAEAGVALHGTAAMIRAMDATGVRRIVVVSAAPIGTVATPARPAPPRHDPGDGFLMRNLLNPMVKRILAAHYADLARMEEAVLASGLDWTVVRPPRLTDRPGTGRYRTEVGRNVRGGWSIPRADVARHMLRVLDEQETVRRIVSIAA
ncbi:NAD(P)-dependent oxidoreductase [Kitasatospora sp. NPDC059571]|uniref:NAD(P)-dependent oxidoreductase n=1 Tax=Kitasatospora sp. NPDC059571 TaxID=3346871 RepID=UPI0036ADC9EB